MLRRIIFLGASIALAAQAWGPEGHRLVAKIADQYLNAKAKERVAAILEPGQTIDSVASWPDEIRRARPETSPWHYVDSPVTRPHLDMARDCPKEGCVISKIADFIAVLKDPAVTPEARREALKFIIHFVGDMHQPLHSVENSDKGGNDVRLVFFDHQTNLHSLWDSGILGRMGEEADLLKRLETEITPKQVKAWSKGTPAKWADKLHKPTRKIVYAKILGRPKGQAIQLGEDYQRKAEPLIRQELEKGGVRLAYILNAALN